MASHLPFDSLALYLYFRLFNWHSSSLLWWLKTFIRNSAWERAIRSVPNVIIKELHFSPSPEESLAWQCTRIHTDVWAAFNISLLCHSELNFCGLRERSLA